MISPPETFFLVNLTEKILNAKLHFLCNHLISCRYSLIYSIIITFIFNVTIAIKITYYYLFVIIFFLLINVLNISSCFLLDCFNYFAFWLFFTFVFLGLSRSPCALFAKVGLLLVLSLTPPTFFYELRYIISSPIVPRVFSGIIFIFYFWCLKRFIKIYILWKSYLKSFEIKMLTFLGKKVSKILSVRYFEKILL